ncbi:putative regulator of Ras-like GTPase activity (Roadblock/LC7/MglB family) [Actinomadura hallensis]|uniref:Putative regulator of Ras-like GTPase activity (Roadblock/LC7/MglB family) n=2 Tax=Actinomadura hallensis TaxID=337895 RepID=A0A543IJH4_9ACTN|nr:putative regulator of Ras-like GTPase activity (Roadblock/LC7/MglB family) [Actinomadura hallensis]
MMHHTATGELNWLLNDFAGRVAAVRQAVILSRDGLAIAASTELGREDAEHLSALASGVQSLARGAGRHFAGGNVRQTIIEMDALLLFVTAAGDGTCLAVLADAEADAGLVAYEMAVLVKRVGQHLQAGPRFGAEHETAGEGFGGAGGTSPRSQ